MHFVGVGGAGMSGYARAAHALGASDRWVTWIRLALLAAIVGIALLIVRSAVAGPPERQPPAERQQS